MRGRKCESGCSCRRHAVKKCEPGCTCWKHFQKSVIDWNDPEACKAYYRAKKKEEYAANPQKFREIARQRYKLNPGRHGRLNNKVVIWKYQYNLTADRIAEFFEIQHGQCYLCEEPLEIDNTRKIHVDHDHSCCPGGRSCGECVRGLSCASCNLGIGCFGDDPDRMRRAADNLEIMNRKIREVL